MVEGTASQSSELKKLLLVILLGLCLGAGLAGWVGYHSVPSSVVVEVKDAG